MSASRACGVYCNRPSCNRIGRRCGSRRTMKSFEPNATTFCASTTRPPPTSTSSASTSRPACRRSSVATPTSRCSLGRRRHWEAVSGRSREVLRYRARKRTRMRRNPRRLRPLRPRDAGPSRRRKADPGAHRRDAHANVPLRGSCTCTCTCTCTRTVAPRPEPAGNRVRFLVGGTSTGRQKFGPVLRGHVPVRG
jgi:hypothetical protein